MLEEEYEKTLGAVFRGSNVNEVSVAYGKTRGVWKARAEFTHIERRKNLPHDKTMNVHPWLPSFTQAGQRSVFTEGTDHGGKFVQIIGEPFAPLHSYENALAGPFRSSFACECGAKTVDGVCAQGRGAPLPGAPFWQTGPRLGFQSQPYEIIPPLR